MNLLAIVLTLIVVGVLLGLLEKYVDMDPAIKRLIVCVVVIVCVIWLLQVFGLLDYLRNVTVHPVR